MYSRLIRRVTTTLHDKVWASAPLVPVRSLPELASDVLSGTSNLFVVKGARGNHAGRGPYVDFQTLELTFVRCSPRQILTHFQEVEDSETRAQAELCPSVRLATSPASRFFMYICNFVASRRPDHANASHEQVRQTSTRPVPWLFALTVLFIHQRSQLPHQMALLLKDDILTNQMTAHRS